MKKIYLFIILCFGLTTFGQFNSSAPWMKQNTLTEKKEATFNELVNSFEMYWKNRDHNKKGSGHKPFKRWENHWKNLITDQGVIISPQEMWLAWEQKNKLKNNKNTRANLALPVSNWLPVGPFAHTNTGSWSSGQGRVNFVYVDPSNANTIYIGAPAGGVWKSINNGTTWSPLSDNLPQIGVSGIAVDPTNSQIIYIATGDKDASDTYSIGVLKSIDGGSTWNTTGLTFTNTSSFAGDLMIHPTNSQILWCATNLGLYRTINGGTSWTNEQTGDFSQGGIRLKPGDPTTVYGVTNNKFYKSTNTGDTFTVNAVNSGFPASSNRLLIDVTASDANYIYALSANTSGGFQGIYRSTTSGTGVNNWVQISNTATPDVFDGSGQSWYDMALAVSPTNKDELYTGLLNVWKSTNGGLDFTAVNSWSNPSGVSYTHADIHYLGFYGNKLFCGSDGGIYMSNNNAASFTDLTAGLQISQFYKIAVSKQSAGKMMGGLQDNGGHAYSNGAWKNYFGADGMDTGIDPNNSNNYYGFIQFGGGLYISTTSGDSNNSGVSAPVAETGANDDGGNWVTPLTINNSSEVFAGYGSLYKLNGTTWALQSTAPIGTGDIDLIAFDPSNDDIMYVVNGNVLYKSINRGVTFINSYTAGASINSVCVNYSNSNILYITTSGTSGEAMKSINGGTTFTSFSTNLPAIGKNVIKHQGRNSLNPLYLGTSLGVYYRDDSMSQWEPFDINLPNVSVTDLEVNLEDSILTAATYGRGIWQTAIPFEAPLNDVKLVSIQNPTVNINCANTVSAQITVKNNGSNTINTVNITYDYNGTPQNYIWTGTIASNTTQNITIPDFIIAVKGLYNLNIVTTITNDSYSDNNQVSTPFYINNTGTINDLNTFENSTTHLLAITEDSNSSLWQRGLNTNGALNSGTNNVYSTGLTTNYPDLTKAYLYSQCYNLTDVTNPRVRFNMEFDLELNWDLAYVEYSTNLGSTWNVLGTMGANWYNSDRTNATTGNDCNNCVGAQWTGTDTTPKDYFYPLTSLVGQSNVIFRIVFHSDYTVNQLGLNIDNFIVEGTLSNQEFELQNIAIYPNPSSGIFKVSTGNKDIDKVEIYDVTGKVVVSISNFSKSNTETKLDLTPISNGIYFVKITSHNQSTVKRIIKN